MGIYPAGPMEARTSWLIFWLSFCAVASAIDVSWTGAAENGKWSDSGNWSPLVVPQNGGGVGYDVTVQLDDDEASVDQVTQIDSLHLPPAERPLFVEYDLSVDASTLIEGRIIADAYSRPVHAALGDLTNFSAGILLAGEFEVRGVTNSARISFNGAQIHTLAASITLSGTYSQITDEHGNDALQFLSVIAAEGDLGIEDRDFGRAFGFRNDGSFAFSAQTQDSTATFENLANLSGSRLDGGSFQVSGVSREAALVIHGASIRNLNSSCFSSDLRPG